MKTLANYFFYEFYYKPVEGIRFFSRQINYAKKVYDYYIHVVSSIKESIENERFNKEYKAVSDFILKG